MRDKTSFGLFCGPACLRDRDGRVGVRAGGSQLHTAWYSNKHQAGPAPLLPLTPGPHSRPCHLVPPLRMSEILPGSLFHRGQEAVEAEAGEYTKHGAAEGKNNQISTLPKHCCCPHSPGFPLLYKQSQLLQLAGHSGGGGSRDKNSPPGGRAGVPSWDVAGFRLTWQQSLGTGQKSWVE